MCLCIFYISFDGTVEFASFHNSVDYSFSERYKSDWNAYRYRNGIGYETTLNLVGTIIDSLSSGDVDYGQFTTGLTDYTPYNTSTQPYQRDTALAPQQGEGYMQYMKTTPENQGATDYSRMNDFLLDNKKVTIFGPGADNTDDVKTDLLHGGIVGDKAASPSGYVQGVHSVMAITGLTVIAA